MTYVSTRARYIASLEAETYEDYLAYHAAGAEGYALFFGEAPAPQSREAWAANQAELIASAKRGEAARIARLAAHGHGPADRVIYGGEVYMLEDVSSDYEGQPSREWRADIVPAKGSTAFEDANGPVSYANLTPIAQ